MAEQQSVEVVPVQKFIQKESVDIISPMQWKFYPFKVIAIWFFFFLSLGKFAVYLCFINFEQELFSGFPGYYTPKISNLVL